MPKRRDDDLLVGDIIENAEAIFQFVKDCSYEELINDKMKIYAVIRAFEIIGEASKYISDELKVKNPLVEWRELSDFRNKLIHDYFGIDYEKVWDIIHNELPYNYELLRKIMF